MKKVKLARVYNYDRTGQLKYDGTAQIYVRAYLRGRNKFFPTDIYIRPEQWDKKNRRIINHSNQVYLNQEISDLEFKLANFESKLIQQKKRIDLERLSQYEQNNIDISFTDFYTQQLNNPKIAHDSFTDQRQTFDKLKAFHKEIYFSDLTFKLINGFDSFLFSQGLHTNTIAKHHKNLKKYINLAIKYDYLDINRNPYKKFTVKRKPTERIFLTEVELVRVESVVIPKEKEEWKLIKDFFLFMSWTGLRYSDASKIQASNFIETSDGIELYLIAEKTKKPHRLKLRKLFNGKPEQLVKNYLEEFDELYFDDPDNPIPFFFGLSNQYVNREIKKIVKNINIREGVKKGISCHIARHTFGTILAGKVPIHVLQKLMQHTKIKETMIYVHLNQKMVDDILDDVQW